jgi:hypothetical protein
MTKEEIWKEIEGFTDLYEVSNFGRVRSLDRTIYCAGRGGTMYYRKFTGKILSLVINRTGHQVCCNLRDENQYPHHCIVSRLVANAFLPNPLDLPNVIHNNSNTTDNKVTNLVWGTALDTIINMMINGTKVFAPNRTLSDEDIQIIRKMLNDGITQKKIAKMFCCCRANISNIKTCKNYSTIN